MRLFISKEEPLPKVVKITLILVVFVVITTLLYVYRDMVHAQLDKFKLLPQNEHFTELYFDNHTALPRYIAQGQKISFSFAIHSLEGKDLLYPYKVYFESSRGQITVIDQKTVALKDGEIKIIKESYTFLHDQEKGSVFVELPDLHQQIHFALTKE